MSRVTNYVGINRVVSKILRDTGWEDISIEDLIEWSGEALEEIGSGVVYEEAVAFLEVKNFRCTLPSNTHTIRMVSKSNKWKKGDKDSCGCSPKDILCGLELEEEENSFTIGANVDSSGNLIPGYDIAYYRPFFDVGYSYGTWVGSSYLQDNFTPLRLSTHTFFHTVTETTEERMVYERRATEEYAVQGNVITFSFEEGFVAVALTRLKVDEETGAPMIPDNAQFTSAITSYITLKYLKRMWYSGREVTKEKMTVAIKDWEDSKNRAYSIATMLNGEDEYQNLLESRNQLIKDRNAFGSYFRNIARPSGGLGNNVKNTRYD